MELRRNHFRIHGIIMNNFILNKLIFKNLKYIFVTFQFNIINKKQNVYNYIYI
jgi:hypothetical protein